MNANEIIRRANEIRDRLIVEHPDLAAGLRGVTFKVSARMTRSAGNARPAKGLVTLSLPFFSNPDNAGEFENTVTHEIAHILSPSTRQYPGQRRDPHGPHWKAMHRRLGGTGEVYHRMDVADGYRQQRTQVPCSCGCGQPMNLGPTQAKRARAGTRYYLKGHTPRRPRNDDGLDSLRDMFRF